MFNDSLFTGIAKKIKTDPHEYHVQCTHTGTCTYTEKSYKSSIACCTELHKQIIKNI